MSDVLQKWLIHQLGSEAQSLHPNDLCSTFQNGVCIGKLLQNYNIINLKEFTQLVNQEDELTKISNFQHLKTWLNMINISLDDDTINGIITGQTTVIYGFLYRLCFCLESPKHLNLIGHGKQLYNSLGSFDFSGSSKKPKNVKINFSYKEEEDSQKCKSNNKSSSTKKSEKKVNQIYDEINDFERSLSVKMDNWNAKGDQSCTRYLSDLKSREQHTKMYNSWRKEIIKLNLQNNLDVLTRYNRDILRKKSDLNKLTRMSKCEEKMLNKVNSTRFVLKKHKTIFVKDEVKFIKDSLIPERRNTISENNKLFLKKEFIEVNNNQINIEWIKTVKHIVQEIINLSIKGGAYSKKYCGNIPKHLWDDWTEMFMKGRPLLNKLDDNLVLMLDSKHIIDNKPYSDENLETQSILNRRDILQYLEGKGNWSEEELSIQIDLPLNVSQVLGFLVFDVLTSLHALPESLINITNVQFGPVMSVLSGNIENAFKHELCNALIERNILPVLLETALQYCLNAYYQETDNNELIQLLEDGNLVNKNLQKMSSNSSYEIELMKQTQTPDEIDEYYELERIECGKNAFINIYKGKPIPNHYLIDCILCYIKNKNEQRGFVLIGYPNTQEEMMILEERLAKKNFPPYGLYEHIKNKELTILVPFKEPELGGKGRYDSSLTSYLKIMSDENLLEYEWDEMHKYYRAHNILTLLQNTNDNIHSHNDIELFCNILTGRTLNWSEETDWINRVNDIRPRKSERLNDFSEAMMQRTFKRQRLKGKSEFDFIDHISTVKKSTFSNAAVNSSEMKTAAFEGKSNIFNTPLVGNIGRVLGNVWKSLENEFIDNMEKSFFHRRILLSEQEPYVASINKYLNEILIGPNLKKIEFVKNLQSNFFNISNSTQSFSNITKQLLSEVSKTRIILIQLTNQKIEKCRQFIEMENSENWLDKQITSFLMVYTRMLQTEVDRTVNTLLFINAYMSKLYNQKLTQSIIPKRIEVLQFVDSGQRVKFMQNVMLLEYYIKIFDETIRTVADKIKNMFSTSFRWLEEIKETRNTESEETSVHLTIWTFLIEMENRRLSNQLKLILARFEMDIKEMNHCYIQYQFNMIQRIEDRLQYELIEIERLCDLFETAINEGFIVRHEIIIDNDKFYLNSENIIYPNKPPLEPFPLVEPEDLFATTINNLERVRNQLSAICPERRISMVDLSSYLTNYIKYFPRFKQLNTPTLVLRTMFGTDVRYVDWSDFLINCVELPYPNIQDLLDLQNQYMELERKNKNYAQQNNLEGTIEKDDFYFVTLWYQKTLPLNPSIFLRYIKIKDLLFETFSAGGKLNYVEMLLALCKDENSIMGLTKAISLVLNRNVMLENECNNINENDAIKLSIEILYKTLNICLKNYMAPDKNDMENLLSSLLNVYKSDDDNFSIIELHKNKKLKLLSEIGFRFNSRPLSYL